MPTTTIPGVTIEIDGDWGPLAADLKKARAVVDKEGKKVQKSADGIGTSLKRAGAAFGGFLALKEIGGFFLDVNRNTELLNAQLVTATGSTEGATAAFAQMEALASSTPFQIDALTTSFVKLKNQGIEPSSATLSAFGNIAAGMGKSIDQITEAALDAAVGEFERLKEFGIKTKSVGDDVQFTFQGITTTVGKNSAEITGYLKGLGEVNFAGAMTEQMGTMNGIISNIQDNISTVARTIGGEGGVNSALKGMLDDFRGWTEAIAANKAEVAAWGNFSVGVIKTLGLGFKALVNIVFSAGESIGAAMLVPMDVIGKGWDEGMRLFSLRIKTVTNNIFADMMILGRAGDGLTKAWKEIQAAGKESTDTQKKGLNEANESGKGVIQTLGFMDDRLQLAGEHAINSNLKKALHAMGVEATFVATEISKILEQSQGLKDTAKTLLEMGGTAAGVAAGTAVAGPAGGAIGGILGGTVGRLFGGLFEKGGRVDGSIPMAESGMRIGDIGGDAKIIGVHKNEGVNNAAAMREFDSTFGRSGFDELQSNPTGFFRRNMGGGQVINHNETIVLPDLSPVMPSESEHQLKRLIREVYGDMLRNGEVAGGFA